MAYPSWLIGLLGLFPAAHAAETVNLADAVLRGPLPLAVWQADLAPHTDRACLERYLNKIHRGSPLMRAPAPIAAETALPALKRHLVEQAVAILGPEVRAEAKAFVAAFPLLIEWEGDMHNPLAEADFIVGWLATHPQSSLAPFLELLLAHRLDAAWRFAPDAARPQLAERLGAALKHAEASPQPLIACLANELARRHEEER